MKIAKPRLYLAAPLFSEAERQFNRMIRDTLLDTADVYLPQEDGHLLVDLVRDGMDVEEAKRRVHDNDVAAILACHILVLVMDGRSIDEGAAFELGFARALDKVCLGLKTDSRALLPIGDNPMIECALDGRFSEVAALRAWVEDWTATGHGGRRRAASWPAAVRKTA